MHLHDTALGAGLEVTLFVEHAVVGQLTLAVFDQHLAVTQQPPGLHLEPQSAVL